MAVKLLYDIKDQDGGTLATFDMEEPTLTYRLSDPGDNSMSIPLKDVTDLSAELFAPRRTDFLVRLTSDVVGTSGSDGNLQAGICGPVGLKSLDDRVRVSGIDWLAWLQQPYHFDGYKIDPSTWTQDDIIKYWILETQQTIITDILDGMYDGTSETIHLTGSYGGTGWLESVDAQVIQIGDTTDALELVKSVGQLVEPYGFDFWCDWDKLIRFYAPRRVTAESAVPVALFTPSAATGLVSIDWENTGPIATSSVGMPTAALQKYYSYAPSRAQFRNWLEIIQMNEYIRDDFTAQQATNDIGGLHSNPQKKNTITILPDRMDPFDETFGFYNWCGSCVYVDSEDEFRPYHRVDAPYIVTQQQITNQDGQWLCEMTLDQIY